MRALQGPGALGCRASRCRAWQQGLAGKCRGVGVATTRTATRPATGSLLRVLARDAPASSGGSSNVSAAVSTAGPELIVIGLDARKPELIAALGQASTSPDSPTASFSDIEPDTPVVMPGADLDAASASVSVAEISGTDRQPASHELPATASAAHAVPPPDVTAAAAGAAVALGTALPMPSTGSNAAAAASAGPSGQAAPVQETSPSESLWSRLSKLGALILMFIAYVHQATTGFALPAMLPMISHELHLSDLQVMPRQAATAHQRLSTCASESRG
jgi:hypothetical protein